MSFPCCKECGGEMSLCDTCGEFICMDIPCKECKENKINESKPQTLHTFLLHTLHSLHTLCDDCHGTPVCHPLGICELCRAEPFHYVTEEPSEPSNASSQEIVAIGNSVAKYDDFDIVVNMNCPHNGVEHGKMSYEYLLPTHTHVIKCGILDCEAEKYALFALQVFDKVASLITILKERGEIHHKKGLKDKKGRVYSRNPRILFHCYAGISRSVSAAIYYLSKHVWKEMSTKEIYDRVRQKRKIAKPNACFMKLLGI